MSPSWNRGGEIRSGRGCRASPRTSLLRGRFRAPHAALLSGCARRITYANEETGYTVARVLWLIANR
jgi:hypothetical protein